jgi:hypothetical protein
VTRTDHIERNALLRALEEARSSAGRLRVIARAHDISLASLARRCGLPLWRLERVLNERTSARPSELGIIAAALGCGPSGRVRPPCSEDGEL